MSAKVVFGGSEGRCPEADAGGGRMSEHDE